MADSTMLAMLKTDLGISTSTAYDLRLEQLLTVAQRDIIAMGASTLDASDFADMELIVLYAAWMWRRRDTMEGMGRMLSYKLHNRIFAEHAREAVVADD